MAALALPLARVADALPGQPVFLADGETLGVVEQVVQVGDAHAPRECLVVVPTDTHATASKPLVIPEDAVSAVNEDYEVVLRTTRPWVGHYCLTPEYGNPTAQPSPAEQEEPSAGSIGSIGSVWSAIRARVRYPGRR